VSLVKLLSEFFENTSLTLNPDVTFVSSSKADDGSNNAHTVESQMSGSVGLASRPSPFIKDVKNFSVSSENATTFLEQGFGGFFAEGFLAGASINVLSASRNEAYVDISSVIDEYMSHAHSSSILPRNNKKIPVKRYGESDFYYEVRNANVDLARSYEQSTMSTGSMIKSTIKNSLMPFYRAKYDSCEYTYTNYHSLNFFTASNVPDDSALIYPNSGSLRGYSTVTSLNPGFAHVFGPYRSGYLKKQQDPRGGSSNPNNMIPYKWTVYSSAVPVFSTIPPYTLSGSFTFDFHINPRYHNGASDRDFKPGTIVHLPNNYAISLVSGSEKDENGLTKGYRILLQLAESCEAWEPSQIPYDVSSSNSTYKNQVAMASPQANESGLMFVTPDNSLQRNHWHHVSIRWGTNLFNDGEGSIRVDNDTYPFTINSSSIRPGAGGTAFKTAGALFIGNYYSGSDVIDQNDNEGGANSAKFFNSTAASNEGVVDLGFKGDPSGSKGDSGFKLNHPLNAEIHDVKIFAEYIDDNLVHSASVLGQTSTGSMLFYLPPYFVKETRPRKILKTPFFDRTAQTNTPFNVTASLAVGGHILNLENFVRDFITNNHPRLYKLTGSTGPTKQDSIGLDVGAARIHSDKTEWSFNEYFYASSTGSFKLANSKWRAVNSGSIRKRNLTILPCDNGLFFPDYEILRSGTLPDSLIRGPMSRFKGDLGELNLSVINLDNLIASGGNPRLWYDGMAVPSNAFAEILFSASPEKSSGNGNVGSLAIAQRTRDASSNEIVIFDISNLYYGNRILPGSFKIEDSSLTGSNGSVKITLRDNGKGSLYRADSLTPAPTWASVGNIFYDEGIVLIKSPNIPFFGKDQYKISFKGEQNSHILTINVPCETGLHNSSSNPQYQIVSASFDANDHDPKFVYIDGINLHDDNLNVIMKVKLAQPVKKRQSDEMLFKIREDF
tara:strand:- start:22420 stop:25266 length:2847 start_codon:yes stop_codon:yes gene_type:complete